MSAGEAAAFPLKTACSCIAPFDLRSLLDPKPPASACKAVARPHRLAGSPLGTDHFGTTCESRRPSGGLARSGITLDTAALYSGVAALFRIASSSA
jgi:hypothetical protein